LYSDFNQTNFFSPGFVKINLQKLKTSIEAQNVGREELLLFSRLSFGRRRRRQGSFISFHF